MNKEVALLINDTLESLTTQELLKIMSALDLPQSSILKSKKIRRIRRVLQQMYNENKVQISESLFLIDIGRIDQQLVRTLFIEVNRVQIKIYCQQLHEEYERQNLQIKELLEMKSLINYQQLNQTIKTKYKYLIKQQKFELSKHIVNFFYHLWLKFSNEQIRIDVLATLFTQKCSEEEKFLIKYFYKQVSFAEIKNYSYHLIARKSRSYLKINNKQGDDQLNRYNQYFQLMKILLKINQKLLKGWSTESHKFYEMKIKIIAFIIMIEFYNSQMIFYTN